MRNGIKARLTASFFLAVPEAFSGHGIKGRLVVQGCQRKQDSTCQGTAQHREQRAFHSLAF